MAFLDELCGVRSPLHVWALEALTGQQTASHWLGEGPLSATRQRLPPFGPLRVSEQTKLCRWNSLELCLIFLSLLARGLQASPRWETRACPGVHIPSVGSHSPAEGHLPCFQFAATQYYEKRCSERFGQSFLCEHKP